MTLLESIVAFVVLTLVGIACLDLSRGAMQLEHDSAEWTRAVSRAESAMAMASSSASASASAPQNEFAASSTRIGDDPVAGTGEVSVSRRPWRANTDLLEVSVPLAGGGVYRLQRLVPHAVQSGR